MLLNPNDRPQHWGLRPFQPHNGSFPSRAISEIRSRLNSSLSATRTSQNKSCQLQARRAYCTAAAQPIDFLQTVASLAVTSTAVTHAQMNDAWHKCGKILNLYTHTPSPSSRQSVCLRHSMYSLTASSPQLDALSLCRLQRRLRKQKQT